jgi:hypothetical protein
MKPLLIGTLGALAFLSMQAGLHAKTDREREHSGHATGHEAVRAVRHDWKATAHKTVGTRAVGLGMGPVPAHFGRLSPEARLAYLLARHDLNPVRFDHYHPHLGPILELDERLRASQSQVCGATMGILPNTAHNRYLEFRRSLNPARFDLYHPTIGALLVENDRLKSAMVCPTPAALPPASGTGGGETAPGTPSAGGGTGGGPIGPVVSVPEPATITLLLVGSVAAGMPRLIRRFRKAPC